MNLKIFLKIIFITVGVSLAVFNFTLAARAQTEAAGMTVQEASALLNLNIESDYEEGSGNIDEQPRLNPAYLPPDEFYRAEIIEVVSETSEEMYEGYIEETQEVRAEIVNGREKGKIITIINGGVTGIAQYRKVSAGDKVVLSKMHKIDGSVQYNIIDRYRLRPLLVIFIIFVALAVLFGRWKGLGSLFGLIFSIIILVWFVVPKIVDGASPLAVTFTGALIIACVALFLAHGFNRRTAVALLSTVVTLVIALGVSELFVGFAQLFGTGSEEAFYLQTSGAAAINLRGLLLAGIVIGTLGVLDDITTAQTAVIGELRQANRKLSIRELYRRGLVVGREHIASLVNTLVLAYIGASLPLFILFSTNKYMPLWLKLNGEPMAEEIIRTIVGSAALILAVPITTILAAHFLRNETIYEDNHYKKH